jgi:hypothetical protein
MTLDVNKQATFQAEAGHSKRKTLLFWRDRTEGWGWHNQDHGAFGFLFK